LTQLNPQQILALPREQAELSLNQLPLEEQTSLVLLAPWEKRHDIILLSHHSRELVQSMPVEELFWTIKAIGTQDALHLLGLATPQQIQFFLDLDLWYKDKLRPDKIAGWLLLLNESDPNALSAWIYLCHSRDQWLIPAMLRMFITVQKRADDMDIQEAKDILPPFSLDNNYFIGFKKQELQPIIANFIYKLLQVSPGLYRDTLETILTETPGETLEHAYRLRKARLSDWGIPDYYDSLNIYAELLPDQVRRVPLSDPPPLSDDMPAVPAFIPTLYIEEDYPFLQEALQGIAGTPAMERVLWEWAGTANKLLMADLVDLDEPEILKHTLFKAAALLNLGLELLHYTKGLDPITILRESVIEDLVRVANTSVKALSAQVNELVEQGLIPPNLSHIPEDFLPFIKGLLQDRPGIFVENEAQIKAFARILELEEAQKVIKSLKALAKAAEAIPPGWKNWKTRIAWENTNMLNPQELSFDKGLLTALAQASLDNALVVVPVEENALQKLKALWQNKDEFQTRTKNFLQKLSKEKNINLEILIEASINAYLKLNQEWQGVCDQELSGRFITMLLIEINNKHIANKSK